MDTRHLSQVTSSFRAADPGDAGERTVSPSCEARPLSLACLLDRSGDKGTFQVVTLWRPVFSTFSGLAFTRRSPESVEFWGTLLWAPWKYRGVGEQVLVRGGILHGWCRPGATRCPILSLCSVVPATQPAVGLSDGSAIDPLCSWQSLRTSESSLIRGLYQYLLHWRFKMRNSHSFKN